MNPNEQTRAKCIEIALNILYKVYPPGEVTIDLLLEEAKRIEHYIKGTIEYPPAKINTDLKISPHKEYLFNPPEVE